MDGKYKDQDLERIPIFQSGWQDSSIASISTQWTFHYIVL